MNLQHFAAALMAVLLMSLANLAVADDLSDESGMETITVNVNEADAKTMAGVLTGIGVRRAQAIVDYREQYGRFYSAEELTAVKGIGQATIEKNLSRITLK